MSGWREPSAGNESGSPGQTVSSASEPEAGLDEFDAGFLVGILVGEGHFGGDLRQPQVTLRMHTDHAALFAWLMARFPGSRLYGPYDHGGRRYYQWMARSTVLRQRLMPVLDRYLRPYHSGRAWQRYQSMKKRYQLDGSPTEVPPEVHLEAQPMPE